MKSCLVSLSLLPCSSIALAQTPPAAMWQNNWLAIEIDRLGLTDPDDTATTNALRDIVGDPARRAAYLSRDSTYLFLRIRLDGDPCTSRVGGETDTCGSAG